MILICFMQLCWMQQTKFKDTKQVSIIALFFAELLVQKRLKKKLCLFRGVSALRPFLILPFKAKRQLFPYYSATAIRKRQSVKGVAKVVYNRVIVVEPLCFIATLFFFTHIFIS